MDHHAAYVAANHAACDHHADDPHAASEWLRHVADVVYGLIYAAVDVFEEALAKAEIDFSSSEFDFLWYLACHAGTPVNRDQVFKALKGREYDGQDRRFDLMISVLRKKLDDNSQKPQKIKTVWGKGYLFVADAWGQN